MLGVTLPAGTERFRACLYITYSNCYKSASVGALGVPAGVPISSQAPKAIVETDTSKTCSARNSSSISCERTLGGRRSSNRGNEGRGAAIRQNASSYVGSLQNL
jgi:hypothetical protein